MLMALPGYSETRSHNLENEPGDDGVGVLIDMRDVAGAAGGLKIELVQLLHSPRPVVAGTDVTGRPGV